MFFHSFNQQLDFGEALLIIFLSVYHTTRTACFKCILTGKTPEQTFNDNTVAHINLAPL